jgi:hypothetical protein
MLAQNTPQCLSSALQDQSSTSLAESLFSNICRVLAVDCHRSNLKAERDLQAKLQARGAKLRTLATMCELHMLQSIRRFATRFLEPSVRGILNIALSLRVQGQMRRYRNCLRTALRERAVVTRRQPSLSAQRKRDVILEQFCAHAPVAAPAVLSTLCTGDWDAREWQLHVPFGEEVREASYADVAADAVASALCSRNLIVFSRNKWLGCEEAVCSQALPLLLGDIHAAAYARFCGSANAGMPVGTEAEAAADSPLPQGEGDGIAGDASQIALDCQDSVAPPQDPLADADAGVETAFAVENERRRRAGLEWLTATSGPSPQGQLVVLRAIVHVIQKCAKARGLHRLASV